MSKVVIAIGGNALGTSPEEQLRLLKGLVVPVVQMMKEGHTLVIVHGNGPQVGALYMAMDYAYRAGIGTPAMPLAECGAMSQGYMGFHIQKSLYEEAAAQHLDAKFATVVTQVVVDKTDPAFQNPTKPIGRYYTKEESDELARTMSWSMVDDAGRGYRRVVPSPLPVDIVEKDILKALMNQGYTVIAGGGGGIPVCREGQSLAPVAAVIDKDLTAARLAQTIDADCLFLLTAVPKVAIHWGTPLQRTLDRVNVDEARRYIAEGHFAPGSMLPKVEACVNFVEDQAEKVAIIGALEEASAALQGTAGTLFCAR